MSESRLRNRLSSAGLGAYPPLGLGVPLTLRYCQASFNGLELIDDGQETSGMKLFLAMSLALMLSLTMDEPDFGGVGGGGGKITEIITEHEITLLQR